MSKSKGRGRCRPIFSGPDSRGSSDRCFVQVRRWRLAIVVILCSSDLRRMAAPGPNAKSGRGSEMSARWGRPEAAGGPSENDLVRHRAAHGYGRVGDIHLVSHQSTNGLGQSGSPFRYREPLRLRVIDGPLEVRAKHARDRRGGSQAIGSRRILPIRTTIGTENIQFKRVLPCRVITIKKNAPNT